MTARRTKVVPEAVKPFRCPTAGCGGILVAHNRQGERVDPSHEGAASWRCSWGDACGFRVDARDGDNERCPADGAPLVFDPELTGETVGGLRLRGWNRCGHCAGIWVTRRGVPDAGGRGDGRWHVSAGGRSLDAGGVRIRAERGAADLATLMVRISRMPAFEAALARIAAGGIDGDTAQRIALDALAIGDGAEEIEG